MHVKAKHKKEEEKEILETTAKTIEEINETDFTCDQCEFVAEIEADLNAHISSKHKFEKNLEMKEITEIKLEVFAIVDFENNVLEARKDIIDNLGKQNEVEEVIKVFVDKSETFFDVDNVRWNKGGHH